MLNAFWENGHIWAGNTGNNYRNHRCSKQYAPVEFLSRSLQRFCPYFSQHLLEQLDYWCLFTGIMPIVTSLIALRSWNRIQFHVKRNLFWCLSSLGASAAGKMWPQQWVESREPPSWLNTGSSAPFHTHRNSQLHIQRAGGGFVAVDERFAIVGKVLWWSLQCLSD